MGLGETLLDYRSPVHPTCYQARESSVVPAVEVECVQHQDAGRWVFFLSISVYALER